MFTYLLALFQSIMETARTIYGVDPIIFLVLYLGAAPVWYYSLFRTLRAVAAQSANAIMLWSTVFLAATVAPFLYVMLFGRNIPWWVYAIIVVLIGQGIVSLIMKVRRPPAARL